MEYRIKRSLINEKEEEQGKANKRPTKGHQFQVTKVTSPDRNGGEYGRGNDGPGLQRKRNPENKERKERNRNLLHCSNWLEPQLGPPRNAGNDSRDN